MNTPFIPTIETERLVLRAHRTSDLDDCTALWSDPIVVRHIGGRPFSREESWARLLRYVGHWALLGFGYWVAVDKATGRFAGEVGFADFKREIEPSLEGAAEAGWVLAPWAHGRGLATEAVRGALAWHAEHCGNQRTVCIINPENAASFRVAAKVGFREVRRAPYKGGSVVVVLER